MIAGVFHEGSGLGDQLFRYVTVRTLAEEKGWSFGMCNSRSFKGEDFMKLETGVPIGSPEAMKYSDSQLKGMKTWEEKEIRDAKGNDIRSYDPEINFIKDYTLIDGSFEDSKYWGHNLANISKWLSVEPLNVHENTCMLGFRGGEYASIPELFLPKEYYSQAIEKILKKNEFTTFEVHTDDPALAKKFFAEDWGIRPPFNFIENEQISHSKHIAMGLNWRTARYAKYAIIPNSAFFILPRLLKHFEDPTAVTVAPRFWAGHNQKIWKRPACYYPQFTYIHASNSFKL